MYEIEMTADLRFAVNVNCVWEWITFSNIYSICTHVFGILTFVLSNILDKMYLHVLMASIGMLNFRVISNLLPNK